MVDANLRRKLKDFSPEEVGNALLRACAYFDQEDFDYEGLTRFETILLHDFQDLIERDSARYRKKCRQNKKNIEKRWAKKEKEDDTTVYDRIRNIPNTNTNSKSNSKSNTGIKDSLRESFIPSNNKPGIEPSPVGDRLSSKPSDKPSEEEIAEMFGNFMNRQRNRQSSQDREEHLRSVGFYEMTAAEKMAYLEEERRQKHENS